MSCLMRAIRSSKQGNPIKKPSHHKSCHPPASSHVSLHSLQFFSAKSPIIIPYIQSWSSMQFLGDTAHKSNGVMYPTRWSLRVHSAIPRPRCAPFQATALSSGDPIDESRLLEPIPRFLLPVKSTITMGIVSASYKAPRYPLREYCVWASSDTCSRIGEAAKSEPVNDDLRNPYTLCCSSEKRTQFCPRCLPIACILASISSPRTLSAILGFELFVRNT